MKKEAFKLFIALGAFFALSLQVSVNADAQSLAPGQMTFPQNQSLSQGSSSYFWQDFQSQKYVDAMTVVSQRGPMSPHKNVVVVGLSGGADTSGSTGSLGGAEQTHFFPELVAYNAQNGDVLWTKDVSFYNGEFVESIKPVNDLSGDGLRDIIVTVVGLNISGDKQYIHYPVNIVHGGNAGFTTFTQLSPEELLTVYDMEAPDVFIGDFDGDGLGKEIIYRKDSYDGSGLGGSLIEAKSTDSPL